ncbi:MAG: amidohydrolase [Chloroflexia bacterium]
MVATLTLRDEIGEWEPELIATRRDLHMHPEIGLEEVRTSGIVAERLRAIGFDDVRTGIGVTGVKAVLKGGKPGKTLLLRADMDALPIEEETGLAFRSQNAGMMHACGHDGHTSMLLATARLLFRHREEIPGTIVFCFQPAEEGRGGARLMIGDGVMENPTVDAAFGLHLWSPFPLGTVMALDGPTMAGIDVFRVKIQGRGGHGALPHTTVDALMVAANIVTTLQSLVAREVDPLSPAVISTAILHAGGTALNIIADSATFGGSVRWFEQSAGDQIAARLPAIVKGVAESLRATAEVEYHRGGPPLVNDPAMAAIVREVAGEVVGTENLLSGPRIMASEDYALFAQRVPSTYFFVGAGDAATGKTYDHHHPKFDIDERSLALGVEVMAKSALRYLTQA